MHTPDPRTQDFLAHVDFTEEGLIVHLHTSLEAMREDPLLLLAALMLRGGYEEVGITIEAGAVTQMRRAR